MEIQNNTIKYNLKNVLFISGNACAGKTTMSKLLAEKHGFLLYDMDKEYEAHRLIADTEHQPNTCYHLTDFHEQYTRPVEEQARWNLNSIKEQSEMVLLDLIRLSQNQTVVADVLYSPLYTKEIIDYNHIVFLTVDKKELRQGYFNRPEKRDFFEFVKKQELANVYFDNIIRGLELTNEAEQHLMRQSGFKIIERTQTDTKECMLRKIEAHFKL